jgi:decaprenylphospho-beta-D-ribofuranose 2-oxidase
MFQEGVDYVDELFGYTFFMDGNVRTHAFERRLGLRTYTLQQTYVIPFRPDLLESFLERTLAFFDERGLLPVLFDVLFVPGDEMILSASRGGDGFAVTVAFETMNEAELEARTEALADLSEICASVGGKIHLVKTVCASPEVLKRMFGPAIAEFGALKRRVDPKGVLVNRFLEKTFPELTR